MQDYPKKDFEVLLIDGGSTDKTLKITKNYPVKILNNSKRAEEAARILGIKKAKGEILSFIDADNVLVGRDWIKKMMKPFDDEEIMYADTLYFSYRKEDPIVVKYQGLIGGDDPLTNYLGMYSRFSYITNNWTDYPHKDKDFGEYYKCKLLSKEKVPAMGSNGFFIRKSIIKPRINKSFIHSDVIYQLVNDGYNTLAKVKVGIIHNQLTFFKNKIRRGQRRLKNEVAILYYHYGLKRTEILLKAVYISLVIPVIIDMIRGFIHKPDKSWLFHPIATYGSLGIQTYYYLRYLLGKII